MAREEKSDQDRIGLFKEMAYLHGVEYTPFRITFNEASRKGKQMLTNATKQKCGTQDGYFDEAFPRVFEGEGYNDPIRQRRKVILEQAKKNRPQIFKPSSPTKEPSGIGSTYGTFDRYNKTPIEAFSPTLVEFSKVPLPGKNVFTNPGKKGSGYGYPNVTIGKIPPYFVEGEYEKLKENQDSSQSKAARDPTQKAAVFRLGMYEKELFDPNPFFTDKPHAIFREIEKNKPVEVPFVPPTPAKKDGGMKDGCLNAFPEYMQSPYLEYKREDRGEKRVVNSSGKLFVPVPGLRVYPISSVVGTNVKKAMNINNCRTLKGVMYRAKQ